VTRCLATCVLALLAACHGEEPLTPRIDSLSPRSGGVGDEVTIRGRGLSGDEFVVYFVDAMAQPVELHRTNDTTLRVRVPPCARTGRIVVLRDLRTRGARIAVSAQDFRSTAPACPYGRDTNPGEYPAVCDVVSTDCSRNGGDQGACWMATLERGCHWSTDTLDLPGMAARQAP